MEKKIVRNIEKGTGKKVHELDLAISTTETDKSLRSLVRTRKLKLKEKEKTEAKILNANLEKTKKKNHGCPAKTGMIDVPVVTFV